MRSSEAPTLRKTLDDLPRVEGPILVIGGGPSAPADLHVLNHRPALVLSANAHAFKLDLDYYDLRPDYIVCRDDVHSETRERMRDVMRPYGVPVIAPHPWADVKYAGLHGDQNSGMLALIVGLKLGGRPVIGVGFDCWQGGATYFHDAAAHVACSRLPLPKVLKQARSIALNVGDTSGIRIVSGPLVGMFAAYDPDENFEEGG